MHVVVVAAIWIGGLLFLRSILEDADSLYEWRDHDTPNDNYNSILNSKVGWLMFAWTAVVIAVSILWEKHKA